MPNLRRSNVSLPICFSRSLRFDELRCSLPCTKSHRESCFDNTATKQPASNGIHSESETSNLEDLFKRHPELKRQLLRVYQATRPPAAEPTNHSGSSAPHHGANHPSMPRWTPERGFNAGLRSLEATLAQANSGELGLQDFMAYVSSQTLPER